VGDQVVISGVPTCRPLQGNLCGDSDQRRQPLLSVELRLQLRCPDHRARHGERILDRNRILPRVLDGHVDPRQIMDVGVMNGNLPAPLMAIDEDDEFFLTLTNVGMIMRPDLFEQHTVHFHGYPNASAFYDGVPDASVAINIGASFTYYYLAPDAGTYFWHCHITPPEHLQMGMVGQLYVRPRQNRVAAGSSLYTARVAQDGDLRTACVSATDICAAIRCRRAARLRIPRPAHPSHQPAVTPTTTATARPTTTWSTRCRSTVSIRTSTSWA